MKRYLVVLLLLLMLPVSAWAAKIEILKGTTCSNAAPRPCLVEIFIQDSSSTVGAGLGGLTNASAGLVCNYGRSDQGAVGMTALTLVAGTLGTWSSGGFIVKDATNALGVYELGLSTAMVASGSNWVLLYCKGATNMAPMLLEIHLTDYDPQDAVRLGLTALPNAGAGASGGLPTIDANLRVKSLVDAYTAGQDQALRRGTAQAGAAGSITLDAGASATDNLYQWQLVSVLSATGAGQTRLITTYTGATKVATVTPNWTTLPDATSVFGIFPWGRANVGYWLETLANALIAGRVDANAQVVGDKTGYSLTQTFPTNFSALAITVGGAVTVGTNNDKTGYSLTQTFPTNFATLSIDVNGRVKIQAQVQQNTALAAFEFLMTDSTNHNPVTGKTPACTRSIDGAAFAVGTLANILEVANGFYKVDFGAGDLNGKNVVLRCTAAAADDTFATLITYP